MGDCKAHKINVLSPDVNESLAHFTVNKKGDVRFGLGGIKGFGSNVVDAILKEREDGGLFEDVYDFMERVPVVNRRALESLVYAGALDSFGCRRTQFFLPCASGDLFIDELVKYADLYRRDAMDSSASLFGDVEELKPVRPQMPAPPEDENAMTLLQKEKELVGMYISSHPLDRYRFEIEQFTNTELINLEPTIEECDRTRKPKKVTFAGIVTDVKDLTTRTGRPFGRITLEDFTGPYELSLFGKDYENYKPLVQLHSSLYVKGEVREKYALKPEERAQGKTAPYDFKISEISLLGNVTDSHVTGITLNVGSGQVDAEFRKDLVHLLKTYKGQTPLYLFIIDPQTGYKIEFKSKKFQVAINSDFLAEVERLGMTFKISRK
jgi:DNA polymerase-3 subunit alpha